MNNTVEIGEPLAFFDLLLIYFRYCVSQLSVSNKVSQNLTRQLWARVRYSHHTTADTRREFKKISKSGARGLKVNICVGDEISHSCSGVPVICVHSCVISEVLRVRANTPAERHAGSGVSLWPTTLTNSSCRFKEGQAISGHCVTFCGGFIFNYMVWRFTVIQVTVKDKEFCFSFSFLIMLLKKNTIWSMLAAAQRVVLGSEMVSTLESCCHAYWGLS